MWFVRDPGVRLKYIRGGTGQSIHTCATAIRGVAEGPSPPVVALGVTGSGDRQTSGRAGRDDSKAGNRGKISSGGAGERAGSQEHWPLHQRSPALTIASVGVRMAPI